MRRAPLLLLAILLSCRAPSTTSGSSSPPSATPPAPSDASPTTPSPSASTPPPVERACARDDECAVARINPTAPYTCCLACGSTPGTRRWHATLQRYCAAYPPANCPPLACPAGPSRAICRAGLCEATFTGPDGGTTYVPIERRCLPAMVCTEWTGCALATGNSQDGWFIEESTRVPRGEIANLENVCTLDAGCHEAFRLYPPDVTCPPTSVPPIMGPPPSACVLQDGRCQPAPRR